MIGLTMCWILRRRSTGAITTFILYILRTSRRYGLKGIKYAPPPFRPWGPNEVDELLVPLGISYTPLTDYLITSYSLWYEFAQGLWFKSNHPYVDGFIT